MLPDEIDLPGLLLRPWHPADAPDVLRAMRDPDIRRWSPPGEPGTLADTRHWLIQRADASDRSRACWAVTDQAGGALLGSVAINRIDPRSEDATIGYWTVPEARGRSVATTAVNAATRWAFATLPLHRIELCHAVDNVASCRVAARSGYPYEGTLRASMRYADGQRHDEHLHARLATDP
jgi:RimJ/RimL family protein N-acetyltransferase